MSLGKICVMWGFGLAEFSVNIATAEHMQLVFREHTGEQH